MAIPLIVVYGSYGNNLGVNCWDILQDIVIIGRRDKRIKANINVVGSLLFSKIDPPEDDPKFGDWIKEKSNFYLLNADFNAIFVLQNCENSTVSGEVEYVLEKKITHKSLILLEMKKGQGMNSAGSLYNISTWREKYDEIPIAYIEYRDYIGAWAQIMGKYMSMGVS